MRRKKLSVSVVVPNHNRDISKLKSSMPGDVEFIEVNRGLERSAQRNIGIREATGDCILLLDSDQSISPGLVEECRDMVRAGYSCLYIPEIIIAKGWFGKVRKFEREFYVGTSVDVPRFVRKDVCPEFDITLNGPEDSDWGNRIPGVRGTTRNVLYHNDDISIWEYFKKKRYYSKSMERYRRKWPDDPVLKFKYRCFQVFTENGKWRKLIRHPKLVIGILFIIAIRGVIYVTRPKA